MLKVGGSQIEIWEFLTSHDFCGDAGNWLTQDFCHKWYRPTGAWIDLNHINYVVFYCKLNIHQADNVQCQSHFCCLASQFFNNFRWERMWWHWAGAITWMNPCFFDMFKDTCYIDILTVAQHINIDFGSITQITVNKHWAVSRDNHGFTHVSFELFFGMNNLHRTPTKYIRRANNDREANLLHNFMRLCCAACNTVWWLFKR